MQLSKASGANEFLRDAQWDGSQFAAIAAQIQLRIKKC
jgi:hypothetical protein